MVAMVAPIYCEAAQPGTATRDDVYARAVRERLAGDSAHAIADLQPLVDENPADVDARLQLAFALRAAGRAAEAEAQFREVLRRAPNYKDARVALAQSLFARGDVVGARFTLGPDLMRAPGDPDTAALAAKLADNPPPTTAPAPQLWRLDANGSVSKLSQGLQDWSELDLALSRKVDPTSAVVASVQEIDRFGLRETYVEAGYDHGWSGGEIAVAAGGSLDPTFRPVFDIHSELLLDPWKDSPWSLAANGSYARYVAGDVENIGMGPDRLVFGGQGTLSARLIVTHDETNATLIGYSAAAAWRFTPRVGASASYVDAAEDDTGRTVRVRAASVASNFTVNDSTILHASITNEARENSYDRVEFALGATAKF